MNFALLLEDDERSQLPTNDDLVNAFNVSSGLKQDIVEGTFKLNELCVVVWRNWGRKYEWNLAYVKQTNDDRYTVDHLHHNMKGCNNKWKYPSFEDIQMFEQIL